MRDHRDAWFYCHELPMDDDRAAIGLLFGLTPAERTRERRAVTDNQPTVFDKTATRSTSRPVTRRGG